LVQFYINETDRLPVIELITVPGPDYWSTRFIHTLTTLCRTIPTRKEG